MLIMAAETERPHCSLHNFTLPDLTWGNTRLLRCMKISPSQSKYGSFPSTSSPEHDGSDSLEENIRQEKPSSSSHAASSIEKSEKFRHLKEMEDTSKVRARLVIRLQKPIKDDKEKSAENCSRPDRKEDEELAKPWNLRKRRAVCKFPMEKEVELNPPAVTQPNVRRSLLLRGLVPETGKKEERRKFSISLSKEEIEEDIFAMTGSRPHRRPKKRPRSVQKQLDALLPGQWLSEISADSYKVPESRKRGQ